MPLIEAKCGQPVHIVRANQRAHNTVQLRSFQEGTHKSCANATTAVVGMHKDLINIQILFTRQLENCAFPKFHDTRSVRYDVVLNLANKEAAPVELGLKMLSRTPNIAGRAAFFGPESRQFQNGLNI